MEEIKISRFRMILVMALLFSVGIFIGGIFIGYQYHLINSHSYKLQHKLQIDFDNFRELYHNDYITTIKLLVSECYSLGNQSRIITRHLVDFQGKHLGLYYMCDSPVENNISLAVKYTQLFYEVK